jgi:hypothetical protein
MRGKMLVEPIMRDRVARKSRYDSQTIARDVLLATGRHPDMRPLNAHLNVMAKILADHGGALDGGGNKSDLATIKWDIIDPGEPTEEAKSRLKPGTDDAYDEEVEEADNLNGNLHSHAKRKNTSSEPVTVHTDQLRGADALKTANPIGKRGPGRPRGRPRKYNTVNRVASTPHTNTNHSTPDHHNTPSSTDMATAHPVGYSAFRLAEEKDGVKKKGRPVGWRKNIHSRAAQGLTTTPYEPKKTPVRSRPSATNELVEPQYQVYQCKWKDCDAELDNLERLKKHVIKMHGIPTDVGEFACRWVDCRSRGLHVDVHGKARAGDGQLSTFETIEFWAKHVNKAHIEAVAWKLGDGPKGGSLSGEQV